MVDANVLPGVQVGREAMSDEDAVDRLVNRAAYSGEPAVGSKVDARGRMLSDILRLRLVGGVKKRAERVLLALEPSSRPKQTLQRVIDL